MTPVSYSHVIIIIIITSGQSNLTSDRIAATDRWFSRIHHMAPMCPHGEGTLAPPGEYNWIYASFGSPESIIQMANRLVLPFLHSTRQKVPILYNGRPFPPKLPIPTGDLGPRLTHDSLGPSEPTNRTSSPSVQLFLHWWLQSVPILYSGTPLSPSKLPLPMGDLDPHLIHGSLGPSKSSIQMAFQSVQPF